MKVTSGKFKGKRIKTLFDSEIRPTMELIRATVFNICRQDIENANVLDLFAGTGAVGLEALSQGANHVTFIDKSPKAVKLIRENVKNFSVENSTKIYCQEAKKALFILGKNKRTFDLIYIDPPYHIINDIFINELLEAIVFYKILRNYGNLFFEGSHHTKSIELDQFLKLQSIRQLGETSLLHYQHV